MLKSKDYLKRAILRLLVITRYVTKAIAVFLAFQTACSRNLFDNTLKQQNFRNEIIKCRTLLRQKQNYFEKKKKPVAM